MFLIFIVIVLSKYLLNKYIGIEYYEYSYYIIILYFILTIITLGFEYYKEWKQNRKM